MLRGEVWSAVWPNDPKAMPRPVLIVSNNLRNSSRHLLDLVVVKITGRHRDDGSEKPVNSNEDILYKGKKLSVIQCGAIYSIEKGTLQKCLGQLTIDQMKVVDEKLKNVLDLN